jgi:16S rRNA (adenine1518-N6/adenine1519-N6)-dimethyltransferase
MVAPKKSLGQHWLKDRAVLSGIADAAEITPLDTVLEIGPGLGTLTSELLRRAEKVIAVELDGALAKKLPGQFPGTTLHVVNQDILQFDLSTLPQGYIVAANVPYYITSKIVQHLMTAQNKPKTTVLLIQKEVAQRLAAGPGDMSILAISAQIYAYVELDAIVPAYYFEPAPKVDSQVVVLRTRDQPLIQPKDEKAFFRVVKAGFSAKRKKLRTSLASGLHISKEHVAEFLIEHDIDPDQRAQDLSLEDWRVVMKLLP